MINLVTILVVLAATPPLAVWGLRLARRYRRIAFAATSLLLLFGLNFSVDPPPPPRIEAAEPDDEEAGRGEPR